MKDVIDVQAREVRRKFLTGTPDWMEGPWGVALALALAVCAVLGVGEWLSLW